MGRGAGWADYQCEVAARMVADGNGVADIVFGKPYNGTDTLVKQTKNGRHGAEIQGRATKGDSRRAGTLAETASA